VRPHVAPNRPTPSSSNVPDARRHNRAATFSTLVTAKKVRPPERNGSLNPDAVRS